METFQIQNLNFTYPNGSAPALNSLSLTVKRGAFLVLCGPSGGGKTTLLRQLKPSLAPNGQKMGTVLFQGRPLEQLTQREQSEAIGFVLQSPEDQIVTDKVWHELAFGLESLGYDTPVIRRRVAEMASFFGMEGWLYRDVNTLSGGQKQQLNLASVLVMQPEVLLLDEPTSQLDPIAAGEFLSMLGRIHRELGTTIVLTEHRLEQALPLATAAAVLEEGRLIAEGTPLEVGKVLKNRHHPMFLAMPTPMRVWGAAVGSDPCPLTVGEGRLWLADYARVNSLKSLPVEECRTSLEVPLLQAENLWFRYEKDGPDVVRGLSLAVGPGDCLVLMGGNGAGKTTVLSLLAGLDRPNRGKVERSGTVGMLPQDPKALLVKKTLRADLMGSCSDGQAVDKMVRLCRLEHLMERHPFDLSGGEQQRAAMAKVLLTNPKVLLLDEPTKGQDVWAKQQMREILENLLAAGTGIVIVSHDTDFCAQTANRCILLFDGAAAAQGTPRAFFSGNYFYTTAANRMARDVLPDAVTAEELIAACGGEQPDLIVPPPRREPSPPIPSGPNSNEGKSKTLLPRTLAAAVLVLLLIPLTLIAGNLFLENRNYYFISLLIVLECMAPFFLFFEGKKPRARELVILAVLCALGVAGRAAFFMLPQVKPVMAIAILTGVALGGESGFLVGAMTMLASNVLFSQGPWTPWQMFGMGLVGFLAGALFRKGRLSPGREELCVYGVLSAILVYGVLLNAASAILAGGTLNWKILMAYCASGFPLDCVQALATAAFLWFGTAPMLDKLERTKQKYGLME